MGIRNVMVVGSGLMGSGISQVIASAGFEVIMVDQKMEYAERGLSNISVNLSRRVSKGSLPENEKEQIISRITTADDLHAGKHVDLVIEAVPERLELKKKTFAELDQMVQREAILATNTSSLSIASIGSSTKRPEKVIGMHFFSPVPIMKLVEIIPSIITDRDTIHAVEEFSKQIGKETIFASDYPGFTVNRLLVPFMNEAIYLVFEGNNPEDIDRGMRLGANHPIGPLELADQVGLDVLLDVLESMYEGFNDSKYRPCPLLKRMVESGKFGKKSGSGFYTYNR
ncbi:3-hydroxyacyl-CoA dehydrogenase family protein [Aneurinibacillus terranovensis]|uniref:3-hydroxyacyl-CoA dehydrogenase family protein n=1 Tax=Aneurinibacillus terranovensis TaxID=278991 RepID=UPI00041A0F1A|nr:3-hydroxyacyl-CoA dehydrogenase NAD-binding domain-containing protein [Aneurinibacillus terranovensis]